MDFGIMSAIWLFICLAVATDTAIAGNGVEFEITSSNTASISEIGSHTVMDVTTNLDALPASGTGETNTVVFRVMSQTPNIPEDAFIFWHNDTGVLSNRITFDYEAIQEYIVVIEAEPTFGTTATQSITVTILDENEYQVWTFPGPGAFYKIQVKDGDTNSSELMTVNCRDHDNEDNPNDQTLTYALVETMDLLAINATGTIFLADGVTINRTVFADDHYLYTFKITATDDGVPPLSTTATAVITVNPKITATDDGVPPLSTTATAVITVNPKVPVDPADPVDSVDIFRTSLPLMFMSLLVAAVM